MFVATFRKAALARSFVHAPTFDRAVGVWACQRRTLRSRVGAPAAEALQLAEMDEAATTTRRAPPTALSPSYLLAKLPADELQEQRTEDAIWTAPTLRDAWRGYYRAVGAATDADPVRAAELRAKDLPALARCTALAETLHLMSLLPPDLRSRIAAHERFQHADVEELFLHLGQDVEVRGSGWMVQLPPPTTADLQYILRTVGKFGEDGRGCIANTAHRLSVWRGRRGESLGVTVRVGRYVPNAARALLPLARKGSILILSKAGVGKTTLLRDLAAAIAHESGKPRVTVVDTSNEVGGDGPVPMPFLGRCRRMQVPTRDRQGKVMTEVIQNHSPEFLVVDELATAEEAQAAWSIAQRGVRLIATCHGETLAGLLQNQALNLLVGGAAHAFLSNEERRLRNKTKKTVLERPHASPFAFVVELNARNEGYVYVDVNRAVDLILDEQTAKGDASVGGPVVVDHPLPLRLGKLIAAQERALLKRDSGGKRNGNDSSDDEGGAWASDERLATSTAMDEDGYTVNRSGATGRDGPGGYRGGDDRRTNRSGRTHYQKTKKKSDSQLLDELERFL